MRKGRRSGSSHPKWNGGKYVTAKGYVRISAGPNRGKYEHRVVYEEVHGALGPEEHVHHKDENKRNNLPCNLVAISSSVHADLHKYVAEVDAPDWVYDDSLEPEDYFTE